MFTVIDLHNKDLWMSFWQRLPLEQRSVYFLPEYYEIYEEMGKGCAFCFIYEKKSGFLMYPFLKRELNDLDISNAEASVFDVEGAFGLNGAGSLGLDDAAIEEIDSLWAEYCKKENIIAEFTRFNPLFESGKYLKHLTTNVANQVVLVDLRCKNLLYDSYEHSVRKAIKKAGGSGVVIEKYSSADLPETYLATFVEIYHKTMDRNSAGESYYFDFNYFKRLQETLPNNTHWFFALLNGTIISVELVLYDESFSFSFLGGTLKEYLSNGSNVLLKHNIITFFQTKGLSVFFLGGGHKPEDGVFKYKKSFSKKSADSFYIGKKIHSPIVYNHAVSVWEGLYPDKKETYRSYFLKYRC